LTNVSNKNRFGYLVAVFCPLASFYLLTVSALWQVYELTGSVAATGFLSLFQFLPALILYPVVGQAADRMSKRSLLVATSAGGLILSVALAWAAREGHVSVAVLYGAVALLSALRSFEATALAAWLPEWTPQKDLSRTIALVSGLKQVAKIGAPALAGWLLVVNGQGLWVYALMSALSVASVLALSSMRVAPVVGTARTGGWREAFSGFGYVFANQILAGALLIDLVAGLLGGFTALLPVFAKEILHTNAAGAGTLRSMIALGSLAGAFFIAAVPLRARIGKYLVASVGFVGVVSLCLSFTESFALAAGLICLFGALDSISVNIRQTLIQIATPFDLRGRVSATSQLFILVSNQLGEFRAGMMGALLGAGPAVALGGACTVIAALMWRRWFPELTELGDFSDAAESTKSA
jgi:MFS family permease